MKKLLIPFLLLSSLSLTSCDFKKYTVTIEGRVDSQFIGTFQYRAGKVIDLTYHFHTRSSRTYCKLFVDNEFYADFHLKWLSDEEGRYSYSYTMPARDVNLTVKFAQSQCAYGGC